MGIFQEVTRIKDGASPIHDGIERRQFHSEPDATVRTFRFASLLLQHVASNLVLEVQRQQILRKMKTARRRSSYHPPKPEATNVGLRSSLGPVIKPRVSDAVT